MPYIITTTTRANVYGTNGLVEANVPHEVDRTAVATLDEAREEARIALTSRSWRTFAEAARATEVGQEIIDLPESGGTIGPLPDGSVIEVRAVSWREAVKASGIARRQPSYWFAVNNPTAEERESILTAFNTA